MKNKTQINPTAERFVQETINLIKEKGGFLNVNLREISKRVGCAHTNAYNYFDGFEGLKWATFEKVLKIYKKAMTKGLNSKMSGYKYFSRLITNLINFALNNPGLYRFIASDPINIESIPENLISLVYRMKTFFVEVIYLLSMEKQSKEDAQKTADLILAYLDGEIFNFINGRFLPGEDVHGRILANVERLFTLLTSTRNDGIVLKRDAVNSGKLTFPVFQNMTEENE